MATNSSDSFAHPVRVLLVMHAAGVGGVETALATLCKYLDPSRVKMTVVVPKNAKDGLFTERVLASGHELLKLPIEWWTPGTWEYGERHYYRFLSTIKDRVNKLVSVIRDKQIDVVHSSTLTILDGALAAKLAGKPHIWNLRGKFTLDGPTCGPALGTYLPLQLTFRIVDTLSVRLVANCHSVRTFLSQYIPSERIDVIHNGVDLDRFRDGAGISFLNNSPLMEKKLTVALVGAISKGKGVEDYVDAATYILKRRDRFVFLLVGPVRQNDLAQKIHNKIKTAGLAERIILTGPKDDIPQLMQSIDLLVSSSLSEGLPNSVMEAMAASKAVVATKCGGTEELVVHGETGYLVDVGKPEELAKAIILATDDRNQLKNMGKKGRNRIETYFTGEQCAEKFASLYLSLKRERSWRSESSPFQELSLLITSNLGDIGTRMLLLERELKELRSFQALFKNNVLYRNMRGLWNLLRRPRGV